MKVLITGRGSSGSWIIRGEQLGNAIGAAVIKDAAPSVISKYDVVVVVKHATDNILEGLVKYRPKVVYDMVDCWPQPMGNGWTPNYLVDWVYNNKIKQLKPDLLVCTNKIMKHDLDTYAPRYTPAAVLHHHSRPGLLVNPIRPTAKIVGYEGSVKFLGDYKEYILKACKEHNMLFLENPDSLSDLDIGLAIRDRKWSGYGAEKWKSNVKLANLQTSGTPCIIPPEASYEETAVGGECWLDSINQLPDLLEHLKDYNYRCRLSQLLKASDMSLETIAKKYITILKAVYDDIV